MIICLQNIHRWLGYTFLDAWESHPPPDRSFLVRSLPMLLSNFVSMLRLLGFLWILPLIFRLFAGVLAVIFRPLPGRSLLLPVSSNRLIVLLTVGWGIPRNSDISITFLPRLCARIIASLRFDILFIFILKNMFTIQKNK